MSQHTKTDGMLVPVPVIREARQQLSDTGSLVVDLVTPRLTLIRRIRRRKDALGIPFLWPAREEWMLRCLTRAARGSHTPAGLEALHEKLLALTKRSAGSAQPHAALDG